MRNGIRICISSCKFSERKGGGWVLIIEERIPSLGCHGLAGHTDKGVKGVLFL